MRYLLMILSTETVIAVVRVYGMKNMFLIVG